MTGNDRDTHPGPLRRLTRRLFVKAAGAAWFAAAFAFLPKGVQAKLVDFGKAPRTITGYSWPWTGRPGDEIAFKVSTYAPGSYTADLVRVICADMHTDHGKHFRIEEVEAAFDGEYPGRTQAVHRGSYVHFDDASALDDLGSFTLVASVYPTLVTRGAELSAAGFTPGFEQRKAGRVQHLIARWDAVAQKGWSLAIDEDECIAFYAGDGSGEIEKVALSRPLALRRWVRVAVTYDADTSELKLVQMPVTGAPGDRASRRRAERRGSVHRIVQSNALRFGAATGGPGNGDMPVPSDVFNGKLDTVRLMKGVLDDDAIESLFTMIEPGRMRRRSVGWWDFAKGTGTTKVHDLSGRGVDGAIVNLPERAVLGVNWDGTQFNWQEAPEHYSAIKFHDDDLVDAEWQTDFTFRIPDGLRSGIYAARLRHGDAEDHIPFFVAPSASARKAKAAFIVPTYSYLAYNNVVGATMWKYKKLVQDPTGETHVEEREWMPIHYEEETYFQFLFQHWHEWGALNVYMFHTDGGLVRHAPMRIPNIEMRPGAISRHLTADTDIIDWLEHYNVDYDVITDDLIHAEGIDLLRGYSTLITSCHTEYHTWNMINAFKEYLDSGGRLMSIGGNGFHNVIALHAEIPGVIECRKLQSGSRSGRDPLFEAYLEFDGGRAGRFREIGFPANMLHGLGTTYPHPQTAGTYYRRMPGADDPRAAFIFAGVPDEKLGDFGKAGGGAVAEECDATDYVDGTPPHTLILARSENMVWPMVGEDGLTGEEYRLNFDPKAEMVFFETPNGGAVFAVGSIAYRGSLSHNGFDNNISKITKNVLDRFTDPEPFIYPA